MSNLRVRKQMLMLGWLLLNHCAFPAVNLVSNFMALEEVHLVSIRRIFVCMCVHVHPRGI